MAGLIPLAAESLAAAEQAIDGLWSPASHWPRTPCRALAVGTARFRGNV